MIERTFNTALIRGILSTPVFTLPAGYRPPEKIWRATVSNSAFGGITIKTTGEVSVAVGSNAWAAIDCSFRAAQ